MTIFQKKARTNLVSLLLFMVFGLFMAVASLSARSDSEGLHLTILHTNDLHAHDESFEERQKSIGGFPRIGHMLRLFRAKDPKHTLTIDAGDIFQGTPLFTKYHGEVEVNMLNKMGYDIYTIGNHEFDDGPQNLASQLKQAKFDVINVNMDLTAEPELAAIVKPSVVKQIEGEKVAFIGGITADLNSVALNTGGVKIKSAGPNWVQPFIDEVDRLKAAGINKIVLVTHCGVESDKVLAQSIPEVDVIIGGHSHTRLDKPVIVEHSDGTTTTIVQTGCYGRAFGKLDLVFDKNGKVVPTGTGYRLINITDKIISDPDLKAYVDEKVEPLLGLRKEIVGEATGAFDNNFRSFPWDSALGDVITDSLVEEGKKYGIQIAFENRGGIRARIDKGPITAEKVEEMLPFDNKVVFATISGAVLLKAMEHSFAGPLGGSFFDEHGMKIAYDASRPKGDRIVYALVQDKNGDWKPVDPNAKYKIAVNDYSFKSGEGYDFSGAENIEYVPERISVAFRHYLDKHHEITPNLPDRIVPLTKDLAQVEKKQNGIYLVVKNAPPNSKLTVVEGTNRGVSTINGVVVPLSNPKILSAGLKTGTTGTQSIKLTGKSEKGWVCVFAKPVGAAKKALISYPLDVEKAK
ncbi:MAG: bifunctional metallophosphatase/5'-nucleotidase [Candidatus Melainabacteria bacterium]|nr:MAG: bifunctional metallophosphatase/5'-nucleotidase [Candidatus Melainabacteria bacterium]